MDFACYSSFLLVPHSGSGKKGILFSPAIFAKKNVLGATSLPYLKILWQLLNTGSILEFFENSNTPLKSVAC